MESLRLCLGNNNVINTLLEIKLNVMSYHPSQSTLTALLTNWLLELGLFLWETQVCVCVCVGGLGVDCDQDRKERKQKKDRGGSEL